jgi:hypothetical protein
MCGAQESSLCPIERGEDKFQTLIPPLAPDLRMQVDILTNCIQIVVYIRWKRASERHSLRKTCDVPYCPTKLKPVRL